KKEIELNEFSPIIATHGLLNVNKGTLNLLKAVEILKENYAKILLVAATAVSSNNIFAKGLSEEIAKYSVENGLAEHFLLIPDFLEKSQVSVLMQIADVVVFPYIDTAGESASGAVSKGLASNNPVVVTD